MLLPKAFRLPVRLALPKLLLLFTLGLASLVLSGPVCAQTPIIDATGGVTDIATSGTTGLPCSPCPVTSGFDFTVTSSSLTITSLGFFDVGSIALTQSHPVGLWDLSGNLLASTTIDNSATVVASTSSLGRWLKRDITPITLSPGTYVLGAFYLPNSTDLTSYGGVTSPISGVTLGNARFANFASTLVFPTIISPFVQQNHYIFGPMAFTSPRCQVSVAPSPTNFSLVTLSPTAMRASFTPPSGLSLAAYADACGFERFDWVQVIERWPGPSGLFAQSAPGTPIIVPPGLPFFDPPLGGYTYQFGPLSGLWSTNEPHFATAYPFYYSPLDITSGCARLDAMQNCITRIMSDNQTLNFYDAPKNPCLPGGANANDPNTCKGAQTFAQFMSFNTQLVGVLPCVPSTAFCNSSGFMPSASLFSWTWVSNFNGRSAGSVHGVDVETSSIFPPSPDSGTGGVTITSINGVQQTRPSVSCTATPNTLWPPNGKSVLVTVSGSINPGTSSLASGGTAYAVIDEYGQVQPSGSIALSAGGSYHFGVSLIAARNGNDQDGRRYIIVVGGKDNIGNVGSCSAVVTVPHDQGN